VALLRARLFGKFRAEIDDRELTGLGSSHTRELICYLLVYRNRPHPRETLASLLWDTQSTAQARKNLRQALWQLQAILTAHTVDHAQAWLDIDPEWVGVNPEAELWLDVAEFEAAFGMVRGVQGTDLQPHQVRGLENAVRLYQGDLLEGWYQDWCLYERERLQQMWLAILDKLLAYCETHGLYEDGLAHGSLALSCDRAREKTHRRVMRLHYLAGDRTSAVRQYQRCVASLEQELGVEPSERTQALHKRILAGSPVEPVEAVEMSPAPASLAQPNPVSRLTQLHRILVQVQSHVGQDLEIIERALGDSG